MYQIPVAVVFKDIRVPQSTAHSFGAGSQKLTLTYSPCESSLQSSLKTTLWWQELNTALALRRRPAEEKKMALPGHCC